MKTSDFFYELPKELIAQTPLDRRDASRLMVLDRKTGTYCHHHFYDLPQFFHSGDCLVLNDSKVLPARLIGHRLPGGGAMELVLLRDLGGDVWECLARPGRKAKPGTHISFGDGQLTGEVTAIGEDGNRLVRFSYEGIFLEVLDALGQMPLPPYITEELRDKNRYQTVYARHLGSAAAPTAGLHFTPELLDALRSMGVQIVPVTLHVGLGTFRPVKVENFEDHKMHSEFCIVPEDTARTVNAVRAAGGRVFAAGTTACRTLESMIDSQGQLQAGNRWTSIFIYPGYQFRMIDGLITNFHLPESTLIMLVSALAGREHILNAYQEAVRQRYRFFSFGDAMLIL